MTGTSSGDPGSAVVIALAPICPPLSIFLLSFLLAPLSLSALILLASYSRRLAPRTRGQGIEAFASTIGEEDGDDRMLSARFSVP